MALSTWRSQWMVVMSMCFILPGFLLIIFTITVMIASPTLGLSGRCGKQGGFFVPENHLIQEGADMSNFDARDNYILLPNSEGHNCFGCSPRNAQGLKMEFYTNDTRDAVFSWYSVPDHLCGWGNLVHGGIISTILDEVMGWAAVVILRKLLLSKTITVDFIKPVFTGREIKVEGNILKINSEREAILQGCIYNDKNDVCAKSSSTVSLFTIESIREMAIIDETFLIGIEKVMNAFN